MSTKHALRCPVTKLTINQLQYLGCNLLDTIPHRKWAHGIVRSLVMKGHITYEGQITIKGVNAICGTNWLSDHWLSDQMKKSLI
jgi:hypothetical protein